MRGTAEKVSESRSNERVTYMRRGPVAAHACYTYKFCPEYFLLKCKQLGYICERL